MIKRKSALIMLVLIILSTFILIAIPSYSYASDPISNPDYYDPKKSTEDIGEAEMVKKGNIIIGIIKTVGIVVSVLTLIILGIKYMVGSLEEKAEYKKTMIPYLVGAVMVFIIPQLVQIIYNITTSTL